jgi:chromosome segregation ATPase
MSALPIVDCRGVARPRQVTFEETMTIQSAIEDCSTKRIRAVAKSDAIYDGASEAHDAEAAMSSAKDPKDFEKKKKACLTTIDAGEKAVKPWQKEMDDWNDAIKNLEKEIASEKDALTQQMKEAAAVSKAIDDINAEIKAYDDSLLLGERDPRYRPFIAKKSATVKLTAAAEALTASTAHAKTEADTWKNQKTWVSKPIDDLKDFKSSVSKAKFKAPK